MFFINKVPDLILMTGTSAMDAPWLPPSQNCDAWQRRDFADSGRNCLDQNGLTSSTT
jgi:hypothetical protein